MHRSVITLAAALLCGTLSARAQVPEKYLGTWVLDSEASKKEISDQVTAQAAESALKELDRVECAISADKMVITSTFKPGVGESGPRQREEYRFKSKEEGPESTVLSITESGGQPRENEALHLRLMDDGSLRVRHSKANGWDSGDEVSRHMVFRKDQGAAATGAAKAPNQALAYLDSLKACAPGQFSFSYPGQGEYRDIILGKDGENCLVRIVHSGSNIDCSFTEKTIGMLTNAQKYASARRGQLQASTDPAETERINKECRMQ
jgi:hypothetical protein